MFQHRHYVKIASMIASIPDIGEHERGEIAAHFSSELRGTNSSYSASRFYSAAMGTPSTGRDRP